MKKLYTLILTLILSISLTACSNPKNEIVLDFFKSLNSTLVSDSGLFEGDITIDSDTDSHFLFKIYINQNESLQLASQIDLEANGNIQENFLNFYIRNGKTYLNSMGTRSQSLASNIGLGPKDKINIYNPFLDYEDDEIVSFFQSANKKDDTYTLELDKQKLGILLDAMGSVSIKEAKIVAKEKNHSIVSFDLHVKLKQKIKEEFKTDFTIHIDGKNLNTLKEVPFPNDLDTY